jgi:SPP1 family predicted phage head-tail adaptor
MRSGELTDRIYFESPTEVNNHGSVELTYADVSGDSPPSPTWAKVISKKGDEAFESARTTARRTVAVKLRYRSDVLTSWRLKWNNEYYHIIDVDRTKARQNELWLMAELIGAE